MSSRQTQQRKQNDSENFIFAEKLAFYSGVLKPQNKLLLQNYTLKSLITFVFSQTLNFESDIPGLLQSFQFIVHIFNHVFLSVFCLNKKCCLIYSF